MSWSERFRPFRHVSVRTRLTCWYGLAFATFALVLFLCEDAVLSRWLSTRRDDELMASVRQYEALYIEFGLQTVEDEFQREAAAEGIEHVFLRFLSPNRKVLAQSDISAWRGVTPSPIGAGSLSPGQARFHDVRDSFGDLRLRLVEARLSDGNFLHIGSSVEADTALMARFRQVFVGICVGMLVFGTLLGWVLTGRAMAGVNQVRRAAEDIHQADVSIRVSPRYGGAEIERLARSFNHMLDRIAGAVRAMRDVTDNIAHDLKSPLTRMRGRAEAVLTAPGSSGTDRDFAATVIENCDSLVQMIDTMLEIAEVSAGASRLTLENVDVVDQVREAHDLFLPVAQDRGLAFSCSCPDRPVTVRADRAKLQRAVANLLDNAIKYTPDRGEVIVSVRDQADEVSVLVEDSGPGVAPADRERVFDRFCRLDASRTMPGHGLGLAFVRAVAEAHRGSISLEGRPAGGSCFVLSLPRGSRAQVSDDSV